MTSDQLFIVWAISMLVVLGIGLAAASRSSVARILIAVYLAIVLVAGLWEILS